MTVWPSTQTAIMFSKKVFVCVCAPCVSETPLSVFPRHRMDGNSSETLFSLQQSPNCETRFSLSEHSWREQIGGLCEPVNGGWWTQVYKDRCGNLTIWNTWKCNVSWENSSKWPWGKAPKHLTNQKKPSRKHSSIWILSCRGFCNHAPQPVLFVDREFCGIEVPLILKPTAAQWMALMDAPPGHRAGQYSFSTWYTTPRPRKISEWWGNFGLRPKAQKWIPTSATSIWIWVSSVSFPFQDRWLLHQFNPS